MHQREKLGPDPHFESNANPLLLLVSYQYCTAVRIQIRRIRKFLGIPEPNLLVRGMDPYPSIIKQNSKRNLISVFDE
jgi:hypothetical protein